MKRLLATATALLVIAGVAGAAPRLSSPFVAFRSEAFGQSYDVVVFNGSRGLRGRVRPCDYIDLSATDAAAAGCASPRDLGGYAQLCEGRGKFLSGLVPSAAFLLRATTRAGDSVRGQVRALPTAWRSEASAWVLAVPRGEPLRSIEGIGRHGRVIASYRFASGELRCPPDAARASGRLHQHVRWSFVVTRTRGAGRIPNICEATETSFPQGHYTITDTTSQCLLPPFTGNGLVTGGAGRHSCSPSYAILTGLLSPQVTRIVFVLQHGRHLVARILHGTGIPFNAFAGATNRNDSVIALVLATRDGRTHRVAVRPAPGCH